MRKLSKETKGNLPFVEFENLIKTIKTESKDLYNRTQNLYEKISNQNSEEGKIYLNNSKQITLLMKDFYNYMTTAVKVTRDLPVVLPWFLKNNEKERLESEFNREFGTFIDEKQIFLNWLGLTGPVDNEKWFPSKEDVDRSQKIKDTFKKWVEFFMTRKSKSGRFDNPLKEEEAKQKVKENLKELGYREEVYILASTNRIVKAINESWNDIQKSAANIFQTYWPQLNKTYEDLKEAWAPEKFKKNRKMLENFAKGFTRDSIGLLNIDKVFETGITGLIDNFEMKDAQNIPAVKKAVAEAKEQIKDLNKQFNKKENIEDIEDAIDVIKKQEEEWQQGPDSIKELSKILSPASKFLYDENEIDQLIEQLEKNPENQEEIQEIQEQQKDFQTSLISIINDTQEINDNIVENKLDKKQVQQLELDVNNTIPELRELSNNIREIQKPIDIEESSIITNEVISEIQTLKESLNQTFKNILEDNPDQKDKVEELQKELNKVERLLENKDKPKKLGNAIKRLSVFAQNPIVEFMQDLVNKAKIIEEDVKDNGLEELDTRLDSMLKEIGQGFKKVTNDQLGAVSRILEGLRKENIEFEEDTIIPYIEEPVNEFRSLFFNNVDEVLQEIVDNDERGKKFFEGDTDIQQQVMDQIIETVTDSWEKMSTTLSNTLIKGIIDESNVISKSFRKLSIAQKIENPEEKIEETKEKIQNFVKDYLNEEYMVKILKDVFQKTIDKNQQEIKVLVENIKNKS